MILTKVQKQEQPYITIKNYAQRENNFVQVCRLDELKAAAITASRYNNIQPKHNEALQFKTYMKGFNKVRKPRNPVAYVRLSNQMVFNSNDANKLRLSDQDKFNRSIGPHYQNKNDYDLFNIIKDKIKISLSSK